MATVLLLAGACADDGPATSVEPVAPVTEAPDPTTTTTEPTTTTTMAVSTTTAPEPVDARYAFPLSPSSAADYGPTHHDYPATDIFCPEGSLFVAPTAGVVDFVSYADEWSPANDDPALRGGISVAIIGDDGIRYYGSHLAAVAEGIAVGARVTAGQTLGLTGKSGNARSTPPHLHFGISRPTTPDDWSVRRGEVPPYPYLKAWAAGESVTPALP